jgi:hypothetical protein
VFGVDTARKIVTFAPFSVTGVAALSSCVICTSTSPPLTRSGRVDNVLMSSTVALATPAHIKAKMPTPVTTVLERHVTLSNESRAACTTHRLNDFMRSPLQGCLSSMRRAPSSW